MAHRFKSPTTSGLIVDFRPLPDAPVVFDQIVRRGRAIRSQEDLWVAIANEPCAATSGIDARAGSRDIRNSSASCPRLTNWLRQNPEWEVEGVRRGEMRRGFPRLPPSVLTQVIPWLSNELLLGVGLNPTVAKNRAP